MQHVVLTEQPVDIFMKPLPVDSSCSHKKALKNIQQPQYFFTSWDVIVSEHRPEIMCYVTLKWTAAPTIRLLVIEGGEVHYHEICTGKDSTSCGRDLMFSCHGVNPGGLFLSWQSQFVLIAVLAKRRLC